MTLIEKFFVASLAIQVIHSVEELSTGFHKKWYLVSMPFWVFLTFEIIFEGFWILILLSPEFPNRSFLQLLFLILMFANGVQHIVWFGTVKKYVPGLITAPMHLVAFLLFYFEAVRL